jgi:hypothetical protein
MDNRVFDVNGCDDESLLVALILAFKQQSTKATAKGWIKSPTHGLILLWHTNDAATAFPNPMTADECLPIVKSYLKHVECTDELCSGWDADFSKADNDVSTELGWRVYCEDWGHVNGNCYAICAIKPSFMWYGK